MKRLLETLFLVLVLLVPSLASAATLYVRAGATGRGDGSDWANAYPALPSTLGRGNDYYIAGGSYPAYAFSTPASGTTVITVKKATVADHGTGTGWSDSYGQAQAAFPSIRFTTSHWVFDGQTGGGPGSWTSGFGFRINQTSNPGVQVNPQSGSVSNISVRHFEVIGTRNAQAGADAFAIPNLGSATVSNVTVSYFYFDQISRCPFLLAPGTSANGIVIEYGYTGVYGDLSNSVHSEVASMWAGMRNVTFRYNIFTYVYSTGGLMWEGDGLYVYGNTFYRRPNTATWDYPNGIIGTWTSSTATNVKVYNNSFVDITAPSGSGNVFGSLYTSPTTGNEIRNNLFVNVARPMGGGALFPTQTHNHFIGTTAFGASSTTGSGDPFVDKVNLDFRLTAATPAGTALGSPFDVDALGTARGRDGSIDRGAYEFNGTATVVVPPPTGLAVR